MIWKRAGTNDWWIDCWRIRGMANDGLGIGWISGATAIGGVWGDQFAEQSEAYLAWRDWIVESLNQNLGYDEMIRQMLAADELYPNDASRLRATGFLARNYFSIQPSSMDGRDRGTCFQGILGLTMNCVRCHDHKYDPFEQIDYYRLRAFFEPYHVRLDCVPPEIDLARMAFRASSMGSWRKQPIFVRG